ncbi:MAG: hypothetical protein GX609_11645 [Actinomycetales bacterium]|nr:hypothetical protein [Actinomycetales bacterium]
MTDTRSEAAALRALVGGKAAAPDLRTLTAVHRGLVLLPTEPMPTPGADAEAVPLAVRRSAS